MENINDVIEQIAKSNNTTADEVRKEMEIAIDHAWENNLKTSGMFKCKPTPEEFIKKAAMSLFG